MINNPSAKRVTGIIVFFYFINSGLSQTPGSLIWQSSTGWHVHSVASTGDLNGDNVPDVFAGSGNDAVYCFSGNGGNVLWTWNTTNDAWTVASLNDVNGDGVHDCLAGSANNMIYCISGQPTGGSTTTIWTYPVGGDVWSVAAIGDLNNDGINDCLAGAGDNRVYCLSGANGQLLWSYTSTSDIVTVSAIPDVNGDGKEDCLAGGHGDRILCISGGSSGTGTLLWYYDMGSSVLSVAPIPDVNDDGVSDCLAVGMDENVFCISGNSSGTASLIWNFPTEAWVHSVSAISDVDGDGVADCVAGGRDDKIFCISGDSGSLIWSYLTGATLLSVTSIADVNGSGGEDCIAGGEDNHIYCIEGKSTGNGQLIWSHNTVGTVNSVAAIADISGNGSTDVIGGSDDSYVYAVEGGDSGTPSEIISIPNPPTGSSIGTVGQILSFTASGASSNLGHSVQYRFDWGDGNFSNWGSASQGHTYTNVSTYSIKAQARCQTHTGVVSGWSAGKSVTISGHTLSVSVIGSGSVAKNPDKSGYNHNESVSLTATPTSGYQFDHWGGDLSGNNNPGVLFMNGDKSVTAYFTQTAETVSQPNTPTGPSTGKVGQSLSFTTGGSTSNLGHNVQYHFDWGDGTTSDWGSASQSHTYTNATTYTIRAQARCQTHTGVISNWSSSKTVTVSGHTLTVSVNGSGSVSKNPSKNSYNHNEIVTLLADPASGFQFDRWEENLSGNTNPAFLTMNSNKSVTAYFTQTLETVSTPNTPTGPSSGSIEQSLNFTSGGSISNLGHEVEYRFNWGDGNISDWGTSSQNYSWSTSGFFIISAQARCKEHSVTSNWSSWIVITIIDTFIEQIEISKIPSDFLLTQNYPNPFNGETWITYQLPKTCDIKLEVFNINGERIATIASSLSSPGSYRVKWNGKRDDGAPVPSGLYMYRLATDEYRSVKVMMYIK